MIRYLGSILAFIILNSNGVDAQVGKAFIHVTVKGNTSSGVNLYRVKNGKAASLGFQRPDAQGKCSFEVEEPKEGIYYFSRAGGKGTDYKNVLYLKSGDQKQVEIVYSGKTMDYDTCIIQKPNPETLVLQNWANQFLDYKKSVIRDMPSSYEKYAAFENLSKSFLANNRTKNAYFNAWLKDKVETDVLYLKATNFFHFNSRMMSKFDSTANVAWFYEPLKSKAVISNPGLLKSDHGMDLLNYIFGFLKFTATKSGENLGFQPFIENLGKIDNDEVKVAYMMNKMPMIKKYEDFLAQVEPNKYLFKTPEQIAIYQKTYEDLYLFAKGSPAYNFSLPDVNGKLHTLESFKGKVVVIDIWAMWCAPCLAEKPVMEKIAESYHGRDDIVFVGISVDGIGKKEPWKAFVKKHGYTSVELLANPNDELNKYYKIEGIPRFLIFDKAGNIVTVDAARPSNPGFKKIIDETLGLL